MRAEGEGGAAAGTVVGAAGRFSAADHGLGADAARRHQREEQSRPDPVQCQQIAPPSPACPARSTWARWSASCWPTSPWRMRMATGRLPKLDVMAGVRVAAASTPVPEGDAYTMGKALLALNDVTGALAQFRQAAGRDAQLGRCAQRRRGQLRQARPFRHRPGLLRGRAGAGADIADVAQQLRLFALPARQSRRGDRAVARCRSVAGCRVGAGRRSTRWC